MEICHCQTQICGGGIKKEKKEENKRPRGLDTLLGRLLVKRIPVTFQLSSTKILEYLSQKQMQGQQKPEMH